MTDIEEITAGLMETFREMKAGAIDRADASEIANVAGKVISAYKVQLAYYGLRGEAPNIPELGPPGVPIRGRAEPIISPDGPRWAIGQTADAAREPLPGEKAA